jgi:hypothetical protein
MSQQEGSPAPRRYDPGIGPPSTATVIGIVVMSIIILIASGYVIYNYSSFGPNKPAQTTSTTAR